MHTQPLQLGPVHHHMFSILHDHLPDRIPRQEVLIYLERDLYNRDIIISVLLEDCPNRWTGRVREDWFYNTLDPVYVDFSPQVVELIKEAAAWVMMAWTPPSQSNSKRRWRIVKGTPDGFFT